MKFSLLNAQRKTRYNLNKVYCKSKHTMSSSVQQTGQLQLLLDQVAYIHYQYEKTGGRERFNIFSVLSGKFDEVNLHSKFLHELLSPDGSHGMGTVFLQQFLTVMNIPGLALAGAKVRREYRKIDLLITSGQQAVVIENKLYAADQPAQLQRYYELLRREGFTDIRLFYLSIDGHDPAEHSMGTLADRPDWKDIFAVISYQDDIEHWLECCIKEAYAKPVLRETLVQYRALILDISGKTMESSEMNDMVELLAQGENMIRAQKIAENWNHARWFTEWYFWNDLEKAAAAKYTVSDIQKYNDRKLDSVVHHRRNQNPWYGIMFSVGSFLDADACIFIERGVDNVYYGLTMVTADGSKEQSGDIRFKPLADLIAEFGEWGQETHWIGGNYCQPEINFTKFSGPDTLRLLNDSYRASYIFQLWQQIEEFTGRCRIALGQQ